VKRHLYPKKLWVLLFFQIWVSCFSNSGECQQVKDLPRDPSIAVGTGIFNLNNPAYGLFGISYFSEKPLWIFSLFAEGLITVQTGYYVCLGIYLPIDIGKRISLKVGFAPGIYGTGDGYNLGSDLEFKSSATLSYKFNSNMKLSLQFSHISNGGTSPYNPGAEMLGIYYEIPVKARKEKNNQSKLISSNP